MADATENDEDEWDKVEENLKALDLSQNSVRGPDVQYVENDGVGWDTRDDYSDGNNFGPQWICCSTLPPEPQGVDTALLGAMANPRERMALFQIEDTIMKFVKSSQRSMEIAPGHHNSFRRLLYYRVAQRFGLNHVASDQYSESGERGILLLKNAASGIPTTLLIDMKDTSGSENRDGGADNSPSTAVLGRSSSSPNAEPSRKKVVMMKRRKGGVSDGLGRDAGRGAFSAERQQKAQSAEERERRYLEARARIFGDATAIDGSTDTTVSAMSTTTNPAANMEDSGIKDEARDSDTPGIGELRGFVIESQPIIEFTAPKEQPQQPPSNCEQQQSSSDGRRGRNVVDAGQWKGYNKSRVRDVAAERSDPDFVRRGSNAPAGSIGGSGTSSSGTYGATELTSATLNDSSNYYRIGHPHSSQDLQHQSLDATAGVRYAYRNVVGSYSTGSLPIMGGYEGTPADVANNNVMFQQQQQHVTFMAFQHQQMQQSHQQQYMHPSDYMQSHQQYQLNMQQHARNNYMHQHSNIPPPPVLHTPPLGTEQTSVRDANQSVFDSSSDFPPLSR